MLLYRSKEAAAYSRANGRLIARQQLSGNVYCSPIGTICNEQRVVYSHGAFRFEESSVTDLNQARLAVRATGRGSYPLFKHLNAILLCPERGLFVETKKQKYKRLDVEGLRFVHHGRTLQHPPTFKRFIFGKPKDVERVGCAIRAAEIEERGTVFTDDRGLLHLVSKDLELPEITIAMTIDKPFGAWASDGSVTGPEYFLDGTAHPASTAEFAKVLQQVIHSLMP